MLFVPILFFPHSVVSSIYYPLTESRRQEWIEHERSIINCRFEWKDVPVQFGSHAYCCNVEDMHASLRDQECSSK